jgi:hypothetical protein
MRDTRSKETEGVQYEVYLTSKHTHLDCMRRYQLCTDSTFSYVAEVVAAGQGRHMQHIHTTVAVNPPSGNHMSVGALAATVPHPDQTSRQAGVVSRGTADVNPPLPRGDGTKEGATLTRLESSSGQASCAKKTHGQQHNQTTAEERGVRVEGDHFAEPECVDFTECSGSDVDGWEFATAESDTVFSLFRELEEESRLPPPKKPFYNQFLFDLAERVLSIKEQRYMFSDDISGALEKLNSEDLQP